MKCTLAIPASIVLGLAGCNTMNRPISSGSFDPLSSPGSNLDSSANTTVVFKAGSFVRASMDNTVFFKSPPKGDAEADKLLTRGTSMKVISHRDGYVKVELDSGEVGYVPAVMLQDPNAAPTNPMTKPGEYQVYPPVGGFPEPLPPLDPAGVPPEGAIPTVIDPEAPSTLDSIPPVTPPGETFPAEAPAPVVPPLPPNSEDLEKMKEAEATPKLEE